MRGPHRSTRIVLFRKWRKNTFPSPPFRSKAAGALAVHVWEVPGKRSSEALLNRTHKNRERETIPKTQRPKSSFSLLHRILSQSIHIATFEGRFILVGNFVSSGSGPWSLSLTELPRPVTRRFVEIRLGAHVSALADSRFDLIPIFQSRTAVKFVRAFSLVRAPKHRWDVLDTLRHVITRNSSLLRKNAGVRHSEPSAEHCMDSFPLEYRNNHNHRARPEVSRGTHNPLNITTN